MIKKLNNLKREENDMNTIRSYMKSPQLASHSVVKLEGFLKIKNKARMPSL